MKSIVKFISLAFVTAFAFIATTSCDGLGNLMNNDGNLEYGELESGWTEQGNKLIYKISLNYVLGKYTQVMTFEFSGDKCAKATTEYVWSSEVLAKSFYDSLDEVEKAKAKLSGKTISIDMTDDFKEMSKDEIKEAINAIDEWI